MSNISNDSGLDDSANSGAVVNAHAPLAATRLSWFLAEVDDGSMKNGKPNGQPRLCVLHSMELLESDVSDKYMTRFVEFRVNGMVLEAKLILAADERRLVDAALLSMSKVEREDANAQQLLVQYTDNEKSGERLVGTRCSNRGRKTQKGDDIGGGNGFGKRTEAKMQLLKSPAQC